MLLKTRNLLIVGMSRSKRFPRIPNLLYGHCTVSSENSQNSQLRTPSFDEKHSEVRE